MANLGSAEHGAQFRNPIVVHGEPGPLASLLSLQDPGVDELGEVMAHRGLGLAEKFGEVTRTGLSLGGNHADESQTNWVGQCLEHVRSFGCILLTQRGAEKRVRRAR